MLVAGLLRQYLKLHSACILCQEKTWENYIEEAIVDDEQLESGLVSEHQEEFFPEPNETFGMGGNLPFTDNVEKHSNKEIQTDNIDGDKKRVESVDKEIQTESFSGDTGVSNSTDVAQIQQSLSEMAAKLQQKDAEIMQLKEELKGLQKSEAEITPILFADVAEEHKQKCHICDSKYLNYVTLVKHYKAKHPDVSTSDIPEEQKQLSYLP